jgi:hypothetical protein
MIGSSFRALNLLRSEARATDVAKSIAAVTGLIALAVFPARRPRPRAGRGGVVADLQYRPKFTFW